MADINLSEIYRSSLEEAIKDYIGYGGLTHQPMLSTGTLCLDLILGGGIRSGMHSYSGFESSAKSSQAMLTLSTFKRAGVPILMFFDAEGTIDPEYSPRIFRMSSIANMFGERDEKTGKWIIQPKAYYNDTHVLETVFQTIHATLNKIPDKIYRPEKKAWFLVFNKTKLQQALMKKYLDLGLKADKSLYSGTSLYWLNIGDNSTPQAAFFVDSYASLVTRAVDEQTTEGNAIALEPREFSKYIKRVTGLLRSKQAFLIGTNQLRDNPMDKYKPERETGGNALQLFSSTRCRFRVIQPPPGWDRDPEHSGTSIEPSIIGNSNDRYQFKSIFNLKNKQGISGRKTSMRIWVADINNEAQGIDPVFDTYNYLVQTGQITEERGNKLWIHHPQFKGFEFNWKTFKALILAEHFGTNDYMQTLEKWKIPKIKIRKWAFAQLASGETIKLYAKTMNKEETNIKE